MTNLPEGTLLSISKYRIITLYNESGEAIGEIDYSSKKILFDGNTDESADSLFKLLQQAVGPMKW